MIRFLSWTALAFVNVAIAATVKEWHLPWLFFGGVCAGIAMMGLAERRRP